MKLELLIIGLLFFVSNLYAQTGTIKGHVYDSNGDALVFANLEVKQSGEIITGVQSNDDGAYTVQLPSGSYSITAQYIGHKDQTKEIIVSANEITKSNFILDADGLIIDQINITGQSKSREKEVKGYTIGVVKLKDLNNTSVQVNDMLDRLSGVRIRQNGGLGSHTHFNINGLSGSSVRVFINGVPISAYGPSFSLSSIPSRMIDRVEVYKGVVPIELAGDALGGAVNVILNADFNRNFLSVSYSIGSFNSHQAEVSGSYRMPKTGITTKGSLFYNYSDNDYDVWGNEVYTTNPRTGDIEYLRTERFHDSYASQGVKLDVGYTNMKWADELLIGGIYSSLDRDIQHGATMETVYGARTANQNTKLISVNFKDNSFLTEKLALKMFASYSELERNNIDTTATIFDWDGLTKPIYDKEGEIKGYYEYVNGAESGYPSLNKDDEQVYAVTVNTRYNFHKQHSLSANYLYNQFERTSNDALALEEVRNRKNFRFTDKHFYGIGYDFNAFDQKLKLNAFYKGYLQDNRVLEYRRAYRGTSVDTIDLNRDVKADGYGFTASYQIIPNILLTTSAEKAYKFPGQRALFGNLIDNILPNYELTPERSYNYNVGFALGTFKIGQHTTRVKFNAFIRNVGDKIIRIIEERGDDEFFSYINDRNYISKGYDIDLSYSFKEKLDINTNYSVFNSRFNTQFDQNGNEFAWYKNRERNAPFQTANANVRYRLKNLIQSGSILILSSNLSYVHWFYRDWETLGDNGKDIVPTQWVLDFGVIYDFPNKKITLSFDTKNILDRQVYDNFALQKPGRAFYFKISFNTF